MHSAIKASLAAILLSATLCATALAQDHTRNWDEGSVLAVSEVHVKDGMFNAYVNDLNTVWRPFLEEQKKDGSVLGYGMFSNTSPRKGEPDLYLTVTYANWAAFDRGEEYFNAIRDKVIGSEADMRSAGLKRGELRELGSQYTLQEITFRE